MVVGCQPYAPAAFTPRATVRSEEFYVNEKSNPRTLAGIEPATFQFVAQHLNHCAIVVPI